MEVLRHWLLRVVFCAAIVGFSRETVRDGAAAEAVRFCGGLVLLLCLLQPLGGMDLEELSESGRHIQEDIAILQQNYRYALDDQMASSIAERTEAYIEDKAIEFGGQVRVSVETNGESGVPIPVSAVLIGTYSESLSQWLAEEIGIPPQCQEWREES